MFIALVIRLNILLIMAGTLTRILPYKTEMDGKAVFARTGSNFGQKINKVKLITRLSAVEITADTKLLIT